MKSHDLEKNTLLCSPHYCIRDIVMCCIVKIYLKHSTYLTMLLLQWTQLCEITWFVGYRRVFHIFVCRCRSTRSESMAFVHRHRLLLQFCRHKPRWFVASRVLVMVTLCNRGPLYFCPVVSFYLLLSIFLFFPHLISAAAGWMSTILWHMVWP